MAPIASNTSALLALRCPRCHEGKIFTSRAFSFQFADMPAVCPVCGQPTEPEPGFYYGAMFVSYAFSVAIFAVTAAALYFLFGDPEIWVYVVVVGLTAMLFTPLSVRYSRMLMLYLFGGVHYTPDWVRYEPRARRTAPTSIRTEPGLRSS
ncbi:DUF983 domain-containing protein [Hymenobacter sp. BT770]|uniref:DUF983 domain-containing protein n=1 Tax=Hymenobacter sp. BT770 TaxID=2886942 RepID=UPI001D1153E8|nr:DUF983 domain-containing protein [Hymenobacter sp. BT770]MCC3153202.1 DUF983 domain-containing protein [Hymenobacter sp. BT770]MDO3415324.1 DUF983 domain-containing protein [Hymenobacter sp. BT770]